MFQHIFINFIKYKGKLYINLSPYILCGVKMMKDKDILKAIEEEFLEDSAQSDLGKEQEMDPTGLKRWELEFLRRGRFN